MMSVEQYGNAMIAHAKVLKASPAKPAVTIFRWAGTRETPEWSAWMSYWTRIKARATLEAIEGRTSWTVPTMMPEEFDAGFYDAW